MKRTRTAILTFDYELFLGYDSGTAQKCILEPVDKILEVFKAYDAKGIFFVDATYLNALKKHNHPDFNKIARQLIKIVRMGSNVELHLHPHWLDSYPVGKDRWTFRNFDKYRLHSLPAYEITKMFIEGKAIIENIVNTEFPEYRVSAFRAGGWSVQPFSTLINAFERVALKTDFSVVPKMYANNIPKHFYDYRQADLNKTSWNFSSDPLVEKVSGKFKEIPVSVQKISGILLFVNKLLNINTKITGDGRGVSQKFNYFRRLFSFEYKPFSLDCMSLFLYRVMLFLYKKETICFVCHPKMNTHKTYKLLEKILKRHKTLAIKNLIND